MSSSSAIETIVVFPHSQRQRKYRRPPRCSTSEITLSLRKTVPAVTILRFADTLILAAVIIALSLAGSLPQVRACRPRGSAPAARYRPPLLPPQTPASPQSAGAAPASRLQPA